MRAVSGLALALLAATPGCVPTYHCREDSNCDLMPGGRCETGVCRYTGGETSTGWGTGAGASETTSEPATCEAWDEVLPDSGKATGLVLAPDGGVYLAGVTVEAPAQVRVQRLAPDLGVRWRARLADTENLSLDDDTDLWARAFLPDPAADELVVVYSLRTLNGAGVAEKTGPHVHRVAIADGASVHQSDDLIATARSLRGAAMIEPDTLLLAGEREDNVWYQSATRVGGAWSPAWADKPASFNPDAKFYDPVITQAIARQDDTVLVAGTWDTSIEKVGVYTAWLRRLRSGDGVQLCECTVPGAGAMAIAAAADGGVFVTGFTQDAGATQLWASKLGAACPTPCASIWDDRVPGSKSSGESYRPEILHDSGLAIAALADGGAIVGGHVDKQPWIARYAPDGERLWQRPASEEFESGAVLAIAVSPDDRCLTLAGSADYLVHAERRWWTRRLPMPD